jgi:hypothetical protein
MTEYTREPPTDLIPLKTTKIESSFLTIAGAFWKVNRFRTFVLLVGATCR